MRELFGDALVAIGASLLVMSLAVVLFILVAALPETNPYMGVVLLILMPAIFIAGGVVFVVGLVLERKPKQPPRQSE
ncbi:MAG: hypothetical protein HYX92_09345 [Chloroflexi bacterium]|nr:hypothetical protein [Chloroflexota bacterium]